MPPNRQVILLLDTTNPYQRKVAQGVATYAHQQGKWNFHVVQDPYENLPYLKYDPLENSPGFAKLHSDGIILYCPSQKTAKAVRRLKTPMVGIALEYGWSDPNWGVPCFTTDNDAIGRLGAKELIERGFKRLAFCGIPRTRLIECWRGRPLISGVADQVPPDGNIQFCRRVPDVLR